MQGLMRAVDAAGGWEPLAARLGVQAATLRRWLRESAMPMEQAEKLWRWYGVRVRANLKDHGDLDILKRAMAAGINALTIRRALGVSDTTFRRWVRDGEVPARRVEEIERLMEKWG